MPDDDYPDFVIPLAQAVAAGQLDRGVAICGSGGRSVGPAVAWDLVQTFLAVDEFTQDLLVVSRYGERRALQWGRQEVVLWRINYLNGRTSRP